MAVDTKKLLTLLRKHYPKAKIILTYGNDFELMVAVILSAQCTDIAVNKVTDKLFPKFRAMKLSSPEYSKKFPKPSAEIQEMINFALVDRAALGQDIKSTGFFNNKAKNVQEAAKTVLEKFDGKLPHHIDEMTTIPGVARKTANVVLGNAFGIYEGIAVDTHVKKQAQRFGLTKNTDPVKIEQDLMKQFDQKDWFPLTYLLIEHGRTIRFKKDTQCEVCHGECELEKLALFTAKK
jgi:endonuclease-3